MNARKLLLISLVLSLFAAPLVSQAQQPGKVHRIGYLSPGTRESTDTQVQAFHRGLRELGWVEGQNLIIEYRWAAAKHERLPDLAAELVRLKVDLIFAPVTTTVLAAKKATSTIPIVMVAASDPVRSGFVASLARPGGNITGLTTMSRELSGKRLELLKEVVPRVSRVAVLWNPANRLAATQVSETEAAARLLGVALQVLEVRDSGGLGAAFPAMIRERASALIILPDAMFFLNRKRLTGLAIENKLPTISGQTGFAEAGGLMTYGPNVPDLNRRAATYVDKILKGAKPADLPVEQPTKFELVINLKTAKALGLTIPPSILIRADQVINSQHPG